MQDAFDNFAEFESYARGFEIHRHYGFDDPIDAWNANPVIMGSTDPSEYLPSRRTKKGTDNE